MRYKKNILKIPKVEGSSERTSTRGKAILTNEDRVDKMEIGQCDMEYFSFDVMGSRAAHYYDSVMKISGNIRICVK